MDAKNDMPTIETKEINGVKVSNLEIAKIAMVCDYLVLDRYNDISSFLRFEKCFGPLFSKEKPNFLYEVYQEICGHKKKYLTYGRLISAYLMWKARLSKNESFNKFMFILFNKMIKTNNEIVGTPVEGGKVFSTRNARGRKVISKFSVLSDDKKNALKGFYIQYDDVFDTTLAPKKTNQERDTKNIKLEMNFGRTGSEIRDRDGISHIGGKYSKTKNIIKFLIFKCRSGKTFYIGDTTEERNEQIEPFLFGTSSCQLKSLRIELVDNQLMYFEPKFQPSLRVNQKILPLDLLDDKFIKDNIINSPLIFEENEIKDVPLKELIDSNSLIVPCISDDAFIDKKTLEEPIAGKDFHEIYKSFLIVQEEMQKEEKEELKKQIYSRTIQRKQLLKVYLNKFKIQENLLLLKKKHQPEDRINMDKFLAKVRVYKEKVSKKIQKKKDELKKSQTTEEEYEEEDDDWIENENLDKEEEN